MSLLITLLLSVTASAADLVEIHKVTPVYNKPSIDSQVIFNLRVHEKVELSASEVPEYIQIKVIRKGKAFLGYVFHSDVLIEKLPEEVRSRGNFGFGGGFEYTKLTQSGKSFSTETDVVYTTSAFSSTAINPHLEFQWHSEDFWRLTLAYKKTRFSGSASTNLSGSSLPVDLQHTFYSAVLQRAWMPFSVKTIYGGVGTEVAKAVAVDLKLGNSTLATTTNDLPIYIGPLLFVGGDFPISRTMSFYIEARYEYIANQSPAITGLEGTLGLMYWP